MFMNIQTVPWPPCCNCAPPPPVSCCQHQIFKACEALGGCIIFLDELDSLATSRDQGDMHEASRRLLGVLLREIDGFNHRDSGSSSSDGSGGDSSKRSVVIGATNRRQDLDAALLSRCVVACFVFGAREGVGLC